MEIKSSSENQANVETSGEIKIAKKPLNSNNNSNKVDINILKSKLRDTEAKEFKKNIFIISFLILALGILGIYLSY